MRSQRRLGAPTPTRRAAVWTLHDNVVEHVSGWQVSTFGVAGASITPTVASHIGGMAYQGPGRVLLSREAAGVRTIERHSQAAGGWLLEDLVSGPGARRPQPVAGGGPLDVVYSDVSSYGPGYTNYVADVVGI